MISDEDLRVKARELACRHVAMHVTAEDGKSSLAMWHDTPKDIPEERKWDFQYEYWAEVEFLMMRLSVRGWEEGVLIHALNVAPPELAYTLSTGKPNYAPLRLRGQIEYWLKNFGRYLPASVCVAIGESINGGVVRRDHWVGGGQIPKRYE